jgi:hypothetical protein
LEIILFLLLFFFLPAFFIPQKPADSLKPFILQYILIAILQMILFIGIIRYWSRPTLKVLGIVSFKLTAIIYIILLVLFLFGLLFVFNLIMTLLPQTIRDALASDFRWQPQADVPIYLLFLFALTIGYREEFFFRSYLLTRFSQLGFPPALAILASTSLFSVGHLYQGLVGFLFAFIQGVVFSSVFLKKRNLHILAIAHGLYNFTALVLASQITP